SQRASPRHQIPLHPLFMSSQATNEVPFESQVRDNKASTALRAPEEISIAATEASDNTTDISEGALDEPDRFADDFEGIEWQRLPGLIKPLVQPTCKKSWVYHHGYRCVMAREPHRVFFVCHICHQRK
ncbi:hypothetical protein BU25DRAFT_301994, partial [Macroventuria anomochaeta]